MEILLAKMNRSYISYDADDFMYKGFNEALDNLKQDLMLFSAEHGIQINVTAMDVDDPVFDRITVVVGDLDEPDYGIMKLLGMSKHTATSIAIADDEQSGYVFTDWIDVGKMDLVLKLKNVLEHPIKC